MTTGGLFTLGEGLFRYTVEHGSRYENTQRLRIFEGGAESNVAYAVAQMGHHATWFSALPDHPLGRRFASSLSCAGVDVSTVVWTGSGRMGVYYVESGSPPRTGRVIYDRVGSSASQLTPDDLPWDIVRAADVIHLTGITPALSEPLAEAVSAVIEEGRADGAYITFDVNFRTQLWAGRDAASILTPLAASCDLVIVGLDDARQVFGLTGTPEALLIALNEQIRAPNTILTLGDQGSIWMLGGTEGRTPALPTAVIDPIGAGDAFAAGVIVGLLGDEKKPDPVLGTAMAAMTMSWVGDRFHGNQEVLDELGANGFTQLDR